MKKLIQKTSLLITLFSQSFANIPLNFEPEKAIESPNFETFKNIPEQAPLNYPSYKIAPLAGGLSLMLPGLGQAYIEDYYGASSHFACDLGYLAYRANPFSYSGNDLDITFQNFNRYSAYAAYRDARVFNGSHLYKHQMPKEDLLDLFLAPLSINIIKKPEVWGGLLASFAGAIILVSTYDSCELKTPLKMTSLSSGSGIQPLIAFPIGVGEEALFRGFFQSSLMESLSPEAAITLSSIIFGAAHIPNARYFSKAQKQQYYFKSIPWITALGGYMGYLTYKNQSLKESTALHVWYDFTLFLAASAASSASINNSKEEIEPKEYVFSTSINF